MSFTLQGSIQTASTQAISAQSRREAEDVLAQIDMLLNDVECFAANLYDAANRICGLPPTPPSKPEPQLKVVNATNHIDSLRSVSNRLTEQLDGLKFSLSRISKVV